MKDFRYATLPFIKGLFSGGALAKAKDRAEQIHPEFKKLSREEFLKKLKKTMQKQVDLGKMTPAKMKEMMGRYKLTPKDVEINSTDGLVSFFNVFISKYKKYEHLSKSDRVNVLRSLVNTARVKDIIDLSPHKVERIIQDYTSK